MAARKENLVNLLPKDKFSSSNLGRILAWLLSTFRIIVIVVEMVVMAAFLSRFWLDAKNSDLNDEIEQKVALVSASSNFESEFRSVQTRLKIFSSLTQESKTLSKFFELIPSRTPQDVLLTSFSLVPDGISIVGLSTSEQTIAQFIVNLESDPNISKVTLMTIDADKQNQGMLKFGLNIIAKI